MSARIAFPMRWIALCVLLVFAMLGCERSTEADRVHQPAHHIGTGDPFEHAEGDQEHDDGCGHRAQLGNG